MSMRTVKKVKNVEDYTDRLTEEFRELGESTLGKLDTALSFMYLFRRFGMPLYTNKDDYKVLYVYHLKHKELYVSIHASYYEYVYFNLRVPKKYVEPIHKARRKYYRRIATEALEKGICNMPYAMMFNCFDGLTKEQIILQKQLINKEVEKFFPPEDIIQLEKWFNNQEGSGAEARKLLEPFEKMLHHKFRDNLAPEDKAILYDHKLTFEEIPELKEQVLSFFEDMKKGVYVRDVCFNLVGYESATNVIKRHIT